MDLGWHNQDVRQDSDEALKVLALDVGKKRIGLAITDASGQGATGLETLARKRLHEDVARIAAVAKERKAGLVLVGLPLHMSGAESPMAKHARMIAQRLGEATRLPVELHDERLTSVEAESMLRERGWSLKKLLEEKKKGAVDRLAAILLLEDWLSARRTGQGTGR